MEKRSQNENASCLPETEIYYLDTKPRAKTCEKKNGFPSVMRLCVKGAGEKNNFKSCYGHEVFGLEEESHSGVDRRETTLKL